MINLVPPVLSKKILEQMPVQDNRLSYFPDVGITALDEVSHKRKEVKLPLAVFWLNRMEKNSDREQHNKSRDAIHLELGDQRTVGGTPLSIDNPDFDVTFWRDVSLVPRDLVFDIAFYTSDTPFMHKKLCEWALWEESKRGETSSIQVRLEVERQLERGKFTKGKTETRSLDIPLHLRFEDPVDNSDIDWRGKGMIFRTTFTLTVEAWCVRFGETPSILKIDSHWFDANVEPPFELFTVEHADERPDPEKC